LKYPALPVVVPSPVTIAEALLAPFITIVFLTATFVIGVVPVEPTTITLGEVALVLVIVRFLVVPLFALEPSMVTKLPRTLIIWLLADTPVMVEVTPVAGLIVSVLVELAAAIEFITTGKVSPDAALYVASVRLKVTGPVTQPALYALTAAVIEVNCLPTPTV